MLREPGPARWPILVGAVFLAYLVCAVFFPIVGFEFASLDLYEQVIDNPHIQGLTAENLKHIFTSRCSTSYYPVRALTFAVDYHFAGLQPGRFKLTNGLIHLANVLLVYWLVVRLSRRQSLAEGAPNAWWDAWVATFSAGIVAIHPLVVEPVTWVAGREELLMLLGALGCLHFHMTARRLSEERRRAPALACYAGAAFCCAVACLSNAVAAVIPLLIVAWDLLTLDRPRLGRILFGTSALWAIGVATIVIKRLGYSAGATTQPAIFSTERVMLVLNVYWLNLKSVVWPTDLSLCYEPLMPEWFLDAEVILGGMALGATGFILWRLRRRKWAFFGLVWFLLALAPSSQIMPHHVHRADRFLYLPLVGLAVAVAMGLRPLGYALKRRVAVTAVIASGVVILALLDLLSARQVETWRTNRSLWEHCVRVAPNNAVPRRLLADTLAEAGEFERAYPHYQRALDIDPSKLQTLNNFACHLAAWDQAGLLDYELAIHLAEQACVLTEWKDPKSRSTLAAACNNLAAELEDRGEFGRAIRYYRKAVEAQPEQEMPLLNLVRLLATCSDETLRNPDEAVRVAERACNLAEPPDPVRLGILAEAYSDAGRFEEAVATAEQAIRLAQAAGKAELADQLRRKLKQYQNGTTDQESTRPDTRAF